MLEVCREPPARADLFAQTVDETVHEVKVQPEDQELRVLKRMKETNREGPASMLVAHAHLDHVPAVRVDIVNHLAA